jgi:beta-glucosidase
MEMPGPPFIRGAQINHAILCGKLSAHDVDVCVRRILQLIQKLLPLGIPSNAPEKTINNEETAAQLRNIASASIVLLKNDEVLPFEKNRSVSFMLA